MKRVIFYIGLMWRPVLFTLSLLAGSIAVLIYRINRLTVGYTTAEVDYSQSVSSFSNIVHDKLFLPAKAINAVVNSFFHQPMPVMRYTSAAVGLLIVCILYVALKSWHTTRVALLACLLFISSSWFLLFARSATPEIYLCLSVALVACTIWLQHTKKRKLALLSIAVILGLLSYIPGMIWLILIGVIWKRSTILHQARTVPFWYVILCGVTLSILLIPMLMSVTDLNFVRGLFGFPHYMLSIKQTGLQAYYTICALFWNTHQLSAASVGKQALLDVFSFAMFIAGLIQCIQKRALGRNSFPVVALVVLFMLSCLGGPVSAVALLPFIYIIIAKGISWTLLQWFGVFPKNPVARNLGIGLVIAATLLSATFNTYRYYVAWPHMETTTKRYNQTQ